ncbi:MAG: glutamate racemase [Bacillota bacterium]
MGDPRPVGLFDSGVGGLTVAREVFRLLPGESIIYFGDTVHVPYGPRKKEELIQFAHEIISFLVSAGVKYIIFACGTNSSLTLPVVRTAYSVPMIGLVEPGAREAVEATRNRRIGLIATEATVKSGAYARAIKALAPDLRVFAEPAPRLVPLVEGGLSAGEEARQAVFESARPLKEAGIDTLILGCTHYPFLAPHFREYLGPEVRLVDPAAATVREAGREMDRLGLLNNAEGPARHRYFVSGDPAGFLKTAQRLGYNIEDVQRLQLAKALYDAC